MSSRMVPMLLVIGFGLTACSSRPPIPTLAEDAPVKSFQYSRTVMQRGVRQMGVGGINRAPRLINQVYTMSCLANTPVSAETRYKKAVALIDDREPLVYGQLLGEGYEKSFLRKGVNRQTVEGAGCEVQSVDFETVTTDPMKIIKWTADKGVLLQAIGKAH